MVNVELSIPLLYEDDKLAITSPPVDEGNANILLKTKKKKYRHDSISSNPPIYFVAGACFAVFLAHAAIYTITLNDVASDQSPLPMGEKFCLHMNSILTNTVTNNFFTVFLPFYVSVILSTLALWGWTLCREVLHNTTTEDTSPIQPRDSGSSTFIAAIQVLPFPFGFMFGMTFVVEFICFYVIGRDLLGSILPTFSFLEFVLVGVAFLVIQFMTTEKIFLYFLSEENNDKEDTEDEQA